MAKFNKKMAENIAGLLESDSYTIPEICKMVGINQDTYYDWVKNKPDFSELVEKAKEKRMQFFVVEAKKSLLKKLQGYTVQEKHTTMLDDGKGKPKIKEQKVIEKHFQPDTTAIIFTLTNGESENWKNRHNAEVTGKDGSKLIDLAGVTGLLIEDKDSEAKN